MTATIPPLDALAPNGACPAIVSPEDVNYLVDVLHLDDGKSESDLDEEVLSRAGALGIDITSLPVLDQGSASHVSDSTASFTGCPRGLTPSTLQSSATSSSSALEVMPSAMPLKRPANARRWSETLTFSLYDKYVSELGPNITQPKFAKSLAGGGGPLRFGFPKKKNIASFTIPFKTRMPWGKKSFPKSGGAT